MPKPVTHPPPAGCLPSPPGPAAAPAPPPAPSSSSSVAAAARAPSARCQSEGRHFTSAVAINANSCRRRAGALRRPHQATSIIRMCLALGSGLWIRNRAPRQFSCAAARMCMRHRTMPAVSLTSSSDLLPPRCRHEATHDACWPAPSPSPLSDAPRLAAAPSSALMHPGTPFSSWPAAIPHYHRRVLGAATLAVPDITNLPARLQIDWALAVAGPA